MDPMKPVCEEPNKITLPSLKEILQKDIDYLDEYFGRITENTFRVIPLSNYKSAPAHW